jgi:HSP20 family molecular chaperone IbpA
MFSNTPLEVALENGIYGPSIKAFVSTSYFPIHEASRKSSEQAMIHIESFSALHHNKPNQANTSTNTNMAKIIGSSSTGTIPTQSQTTNDFGNPFPVAHQTTTTQGIQEPPSSIQPEHQSTHTSLLRLLSETAHHIARSHPHLHTFFPRFDLEEHATVYELFGELPGCKQKDIFIHAVDSTSITISGHTYRYSYPEDPTSGKLVEVKHVPVEGPDAVEKKTSWPGLAEPGMEAAVAAQEGGAAMSEEKDNNSSEKFKASETNGNGTVPTKAVNDKEQNGVTKELPKPEEKTLFQERLVGKFVRTIRFPGPILAEKVVAELKDGVLRVRVEKDLEKEEAFEKEKKRIEIAWAGASMWGI